MSDTEGLSVVFGANIDQITDAGSMIDRILSSIASSAEVSGSEISSSMERAATSFSAISESAAGISVGVEEGVAGATAALGEIPIAAEEAASRTESASSGFSMGGMVSSVGMGIFSLQALGSMATTTGMALLGPASAAENTQASFSNLLGSTQAASTELDQLNQFAAKTQFKTQDIDNAASSMIAFKTPVKNIVPELTAVGDALTAVGKGTPAEMQGVVNVLGKIGIQGKLTQGDITQLGAHGINAMDLIVEGSGKSQKAVEDMVKKGTMPAADAIDALTKGIEKNPVYSGGMAKQSNTLSGQMSTLSSDFDQVMAAALSPALPGLEQTFGKLAVILTDPSFKAFAVTMGKDLVGGIANAVTGITNMVTTGKNLVDFFTHNQVAMDALVATLAGVGAVTMAVVIPAMIAWAIAMGPVALEAIIIAGPFVLLGIVVAAVIFGIILAVQHWSQIMDWAHGVIKTSTDGINGFFGNVGGIVHNITGGINDAFTGMGNTIHSIWDGVVSHVKGAINTIIDGIDSFIRFIDGIQIHIPSVGVGPLQTPAFDWGGLGIPTIPRLAAGGTIAPGGWGIAGETGQPELVYGGSSGATVVGASQTASLLAGAGDGDTHIHVYLDSREMTDTIMTRVTRTIRSQGGRMASI